MTEELEGGLPQDVCRLAERVLAVAKEQGLKLATAESCTGGLLAALLTDVRGYGRVFDRGFVVYTDKAKHELLGVATGILDRNGAVSRPAAEAMASGALEGSDANLAISITGFAGPGGAEDEEGLVHFALAREGAAVTWREKHFGSIGRDGVRIAAIRTALDMIYEELEP